MKKKLIYGSIAGVLVVILVVVGIIIGGKDESASKDNDKIVSGDLETDKNPSDTSEEDESADGSDEIIGQAPEQDEEEDDSEVENNKDNSDEFVDDSTEEDDSSNSENEDNSSNDNSSNSGNTGAEDNSGNTDSGNEDNSNSGSTENEDNSSSTDSGNEDNSNTENEENTDSGNSSNTSSGFDNVSWTGNGVNLGSLGITIPTLKDFNDEALKGEANEGCGWTGASGDESFKILDNTLYTVREALVNKNVLNAKTGQGFLIENYSISFDWASSSAYHDFQLTRDPATGIYTLSINMPLDSYVSSFGKELAPYNRDVVLVLCSVFSSTPQTVYNTLYEDLYGTECISMTSYTSVGDCKIKYDNTQSYLGHYVYLIKGN